MAHLPIARFLNSPISLHVTEDSASPLDPGLHALVNPGTPFTCTFDDVLDRHERHWNIFGQPQNPLAVIRDAINDLKQGFFRFWKASHPDGWYDEKDRHGADGIHFSSEDARPSGYFFAEALAAYFIEQRMKVPPGRIFFYAGTEARPDLLVKPKKNRPLAAALSGRPLLGFEARSRKGADMKYDLHADEIRTLATKLAASPASKIIAIYSMYGVNSATDTLTRIHLADPSKEGAIVTDETVDEAVLTYYWGVCSRLGLWFHRRILAEALAELSPRYNPLVSQDAPSQGLGFLPRREIPDAIQPSRVVTYRGREFATLIERYQKNEISFESAIRSVERGEYGEVYFRGLRNEVLSTISERRFPFLRDFLDENAGRLDIDARVSPDGVLTKVTPGRESDVSDFFTAEMAKPPNQRLGGRQG